MAKSENIFKRCWNGGINKVKSTDMFGKAITFTYKGEE